MENISHFPFLKVDGATISRPTDNANIIGKTTGEEASKDPNNPVGDVPNRLPNVNY